MRRIQYLLLALCLLGTAGAPTSSAAKSSAVPFNRAACPFTLGKGMIQGRTVYCGYLTVPENRAAPAGRVIRLAVAVFKSPSASPAPAPLIYLQGGPGGAIVEDLGSSITKENAAAIVGKQDLVLVDQRGDGLSTPFLGCKPLRDLVVSWLSGLPGHAPANEAYLRAAQRCYTAFGTAGIDLGSYNTVSDAADIAELGPAMGYKRVNVYGVSYGTRVALTLMRLYPATIRSVVLDAVLPTQANMFTQVPASMGRVFRVLFAGCAADKACNAAYPHLDRTFYTLVDRLNAKPATVEAKNPATSKTVQVVLTGDRLVDVVFHMLYVTANIPYIPRLIDAAARGYYAYVAQRLFATLADVISYASGTSEGTYYSVECGEDAPFTSALQIAAGISKMPPALQSNARGSQTASYSTCTQVWHVVAVPAAQKQPVRSAIPTLVLNGQYDPITPPDLGELAAETLSHADSYTFPGVGHGAYLSASCPHGMAVAFLANPTARPDASCIRAMTGPRWALPLQASGAATPLVGHAGPAPTATPTASAAPTHTPVPTSTKVPASTHTPIPFSTAGARR